MLFVCAGNICRSPTAHGVMQRLVADAGLERQIEVDSAGTGAWHAGELPDPRSRKAALKRGIVLDHPARQVLDGDFGRFDHLLAMDGENLSWLLAKARPSERAKIKRLRTFDGTAGEHADVPDPYYGGDQGFEAVLDMVDRACRGLLVTIRADLGAR